MLFKERKERKRMNGMFYSRTGCQVKTSLRTELVLPKESGPTVVTVTKSPLLLMSQIFSNDSGALILMKYDNPAQSWFRTQDPLNTRRCNSSWSVSLQDLPCRMNEINFYINEEISMTTRTDDTPFKSVKHRFATGGYFFLTHCFCEVYSITLPLRNELLREY